MSRSNRLEYIVRFECQPVNFRDLRISEILEIEDLDANRL
jgi:hypothetical protein